MLIGQIGDLHLTNRKPVRRKDNYFQTQMKKLEFGIQTLKDRGVENFIQVGDFFDTPFVANTVKSEIIKLLNRLNVHIYCCYGQHDISGHSSSTLPNSPLHVLESAGVVTICHSGRTYYLGDNHQLYGASFGEEVPVPEIDDMYNILVTHMMIGDQPLWPGQTLASPKKFLVDHPTYNLVCVGDYHYRFDQIVKSAEKGYRLMVNTGAMLRKSIGLRDLALEPAVALINTDSNSVEYIKLPADSVDTVFDLERENEEANREAALAFILKLQEQDHKAAGWKDNLKMVFEERETPERVRTLIDKYLEESCPKS